MHSQLFTIATAAAALLSPFALAAQDNTHHVREGHSRGRARAVHRRSTNSTLPSGWSLTAACLSDAAAPNRLLSTSSNFMTTLTPSVCAASCDSEGYTYAAVQDGHECWCSSSLNNGTTAGQRADVSNCATPCAGDASQNCGGVWFLSLYSKTTTSGSSTHSSSTAHSSTSAAVRKPASTSVSTSHAATTTKAATTVKASTTKASTSAASTSTSKFKLIESMAGSSFFDHFSFFSSADPTGGQVDYVTSSVATSSKLAYVDSDGVAVMKVDNSTWLSSGQSRKSVRVQSNKAYSSGLMIFDVASMPYGCSVWPAMWTVGPNWPEGGEIDIIENVNNATVNQVTLHTGESTSCTTNAVSKAAVSTSMLGTTCASSQTADAGCAYQDTSSSAFGAGFNAAGGAVFALWIDQGNSANNGAGGVTVWKFARDSVPSDITSGSPNPLSSAWGTPQATWPATSSCKTSAVIGAQQVVFDITLCGGWCASDYGNSGCPGTCSERIEDPTNFNTAAWRINSVKVYQ